MKLTAAILILVILSQVLFWFGVSYTAAALRPGSGIQYKDALDMTTFAANVRVLGTRDIWSALPPLTSIVFGACTLTTLICAFLRRRRSVQFVAIGQLVFLALPGAVGLISLAAILLNGITVGLNGEALHEDWFPSAAMGTLLLAAVLILFNGPTRRRSSATT